MRILLFIICFVISGCTTFTPKDLKSPCVAISNPDGTPVPCAKRNANDHWLI
jgi:starvation-inducible outer membrane lipoprotein